jgi:hypothetical protein
LFLVLLLALLVTVLFPGQALGETSDGQPRPALQADKWSSYTPWQLNNSNRYTGTGSTARGNEPVPVFAAIMGLLLLVYSGALLLRRKPALFRWQTVAVIMFSCWLALDLLWQTRLIRQLDATWETFAGKSVRQRLLASDDGFLVPFIERTRERVGEPDARLFLASNNDYGAMIVAYYLAPINTYWDRHGAQKLPAAGDLAIGDYILLVPPHTEAYVRRAKTIRAGDGKPVAVEEVANERLGVLLRVI